MNKCANCGKQFEGEVEFAIHRDGFGIGPEVPLCIDCGAYPRPTCGEIWFNIAARRARQVQPVNVIPRTQSGRPSSLGGATAINAQKPTSPRSRM
jgi:NAD-dependent SIR2 family protein deacetylase